MRECCLQALHLALHSESSIERNKIIEKLKILRMQRTREIFYTSAGKTIEVELCQANNTILEITAHNLAYTIERRRILKILLVLAALYSGYLYYFSANYLLIVHLAFLSSTALLGLTLVNLVESESIKLVKDFALHTSSTYFGGRVVNLFVPIDYVQDVVINEVVYNYKVIFVLVALTKGQIYFEKPIIPLMKNLHPELKCLETIYKKISKMLAQ